MLFRSGFALLVTLDDPRAVPRIVRKETGAHRWLQRSIGTVRTSDLAALEGEIEGLGANAGRMLLEVHASGRVTMAGERDVRRRLDRLESRLLHLARRLDNLVVAPVDDDIERLPEGPLREIGRELSRLAVDSDGAEQIVAQRALRHLFELSDSSTAGVTTSGTARESIGEAA